MRWGSVARIAAVASVLLCVAGERTLLVTGVAFEESCDGAASAALAALLCGALEARGLRARTVTAPVECAAPHAPDEPACLARVLRLLARGELHAALVPRAEGSAPASPRLRDAGLEALGAGDAGDARRGCWATGPLRSLAELAMPARAAPYALSTADLEAARALLHVDQRYKCSAREGNGSSVVGSLELTGATVLVGEECEARVLEGVVHEHGLHATVVPVGRGWDAARVLAALAARNRTAAIVCGRALDSNALRRTGARVLGPPPCVRRDCPFDARPLLKLMNARELADTPSARRALDRLSLGPGETLALATAAGRVGPEAAAAASLAAHSEWALGGGEVRVAVMIPVSTRRETYEADALRAAAELAEEDAAAASGRGSTDSVVFKVELLDDGCSATRAFKHLTDALGAEFHALSGVAGPACAAAFGDVARQSRALPLPVLAYTGVAAPAEGALLAACDARDGTLALAALLARLGWTRAALLSEAGARAALDVVHLGLELVVHEELPEGEDLPVDLIERWARRAAAATARVLVVCVEDARAARAALCAARAAGLTPRAGAVLLLPAAAALPARWLQHGGSASCSRADLVDQAEGHLRLTPEWVARWRPDALKWTRRWRARTSASSSADSPSPPPHAALLYDTLRLWADALAQLLRDSPQALEDMHRPDRVRALEKLATRPYDGVTGRFEWEGLSRGGALCALRVEQWSAMSGGVEVGQWALGGLRLDESALRWRTEDGRAPDDGAERCALRSLARALRTDCRAAAAGVAAVVLSALVALLAGVAWHCRRRAEREHRSRLVAFGMRALGPKTGADRWELARERVVINRRLGCGAFGAVYGGHALLGIGRAWEPVAVKTLKVGADTEEKLDFLSEAEAMKRFDHENVVRLLGVVTRSEPVCTVMEYMLYGDLKGYLVSRRHVAGASADVTPTRLTGMARDAACGLAYLARMRYVHRDVAARNCLVGAERRVKLADFGMTRVVFENDYYRFGRKGMLPVRWMAPESLAQGVFSTDSDVWSFGVLLYEIVTFGALPFRGRSNSEVLECVKAGSTLDLPPALKPQLEGLIRSCWRRERRARPTAAALAGFLAEWPRLLTPCLEPPATLSAAGAVNREVRWSSWTAPTSTGTDSTYLSADAALASEADPFLPVPSS